MKFNEKLLALRKKQGLSQEELGMELQVSRQTISKWESGQSYPDFQRLVLLSDYLGISLDELVKDIDVQDIREKNLTDEKVSSIYSDLLNSKYPGGVTEQKKMLEEEGHVVISKGRTNIKYYVKDYEQKLIVLE